MSINDLTKLKVVEALRDGRLSRKQASEKLSISERQVSRYIKSVREHGPKGILHGNKGKPPKNKFPSELKQKYLRLYQQVYKGFNFRHALELMVQHESVAACEVVSYQTFRKWCREEGLGKVKKRRVSKARVQRERSACEGAMLQMDGSHHRWFGNKESCLMAMIDDATSLLVESSFSKSETTHDSLQLLRKLVETKGIPEVIVTDNAGWSGNQKRGNFTQFGRACEQLGIILVRTSSSESKGRVERFFRTAQDRLIPELALYGIKSQQDANRYLRQCFSEHWNQTFAVQPRAPTNRYQPVPAHLDLEEVFSYQYERSVGRDQTIHYRNKRYRIKNRELGSLWKKNVVISETAQGAILSMKWAGHRLEWEEAPMAKPRQKKWA